MFDELNARFDHGELLPAVVQDIDSKEVLMVAWVNKEAFAATTTSMRATFWSRSRNELWEKGTTSGNTQLIHSITLDCDGDAILLKVEQKGVACHTGDKSCFHQKIK